MNTAISIHSEPMGARVTISVTHNQQMNIELGHIIRACDIPEIIDELVDAFNKMHPSSTPIEVNYHTAED